MAGSLRFFFSRLIKLLANASKPFTYGFHWLAPKRRFTIPTYSPPLWSSKIQKKIPNIVWQTNWTADVTLPVYLNYLFNRIMAPTYHFNFVTDEEIERFVAAAYGERISKDYNRLRIGAAKADFWRILVLNRFGGVYLDIDAHFLWPLEKIIQPEFDDLFLIQKDKTLTNYFLASTGDSDKLGRIIERIASNIETDRVNDVYWLTGPRAIIEALDGLELNTAYYQTTCNQGNFTSEKYQYFDKPARKWWRQQQDEAVLRN